MITDMDEQRAKEEKVLELAQQVADLLNQIEDLKAGPVRAANGHLTLPAAYVRRFERWEVVEG